MADRDRNPVAKVLKTLVWLAQAPATDVGVRELAAAMEISPSSAHRILLALAEEGYVKQDPASQRYAIDVEFWALAQLVVAKAPIRQTALDGMRRLVDACNETALLGLYDGTRQEMMFAASVESAHPLRYAVELNKWGPLYTGASGLAIMAFLPEDEIQSIIRRSRLVPLTPRSITEPYRLEAELAAVRRQGYAFTKGQRITGAVGLAAPIFGANNAVLGDICLTIPEQRFDDAGKPHLVDLLLACANGISEKLGGMRRPDPKAA